MSKHRHSIDGTGTNLVDCAELTHCPSVCDCAPGACTATVGEPDELRLVERAIDAQLAVNEIVARNEKHDARCRAAAMVAAIENVRDAELESARTGEAAWATLRTADLAAIADGYLEDGLMACRCGSSDEREESIAAFTESMRDADPNGVDELVESSAKLRADIASRQEVCPLKGAHNAHRVAVNRYTSWNCAGRGPYETRSATGEWFACKDVHELRDRMQLVGLRYSELVAHVADIDAGLVVTAENGREFRLATGERIAR